MGGYTCFAFFQRGKWVRVPVSQPPQVKSRSVWRLKASSIESRSSDLLSVIPNSTAGYTASPASQSTVQLFATSLRRRYGAGGGGVGWGGVGGGAFGGGGGGEKEGSAVPVPVQWLCR